MPELFTALGFHWDRPSVAVTLPTHSSARVAFRFQKMLPEFVWDASVLEGNPFTFPEVKTILDGITVGGRKISDQEQVLNLAESARHLLASIKQGAFSLDKATFTHLHALVARNEALEWGHFRGEGTGAPALNRVFQRGLLAFQDPSMAPFERGAAFFLFGALQQFFFDGNKRTSRLMMNGVLMSAGVDAISVAAAKAQEFNEKMVDFYRTQNATEMMVFLLGCHESL